MILKAENISFKYGSKLPNILNSVSISVPHNKIIGLMGDSGSGKSTLCKIMAGYIQNFEGSVSIDDKPIDNSGFNPVQLIFQHPEKTMNPKWKMDKILKESWNPPNEIMSKFGIKKKWLNRWPNELSGGELQRFSILRVLNPKTKFIIADEITTMLDAVTQVQIWSAIIDYTDSKDIGILFVSHDKKLLNTICDDVLYLNDLNK